MDGVWGARHDLLLAYSGKAFLLELELGDLDAVVRFERWERSGRSTEKGRNLQF